MKNDGRKLSREVLESYRLRAIALREDLGYSVREISEIFDITYESVSRWFTQYRRGGKDALKQRKAKGKVRTLKTDDLQWLQGVLQDSALDHGFLTPLWTGTYVGQLFRRERKVSLDRVTIWRYLVRLGLSFQKPEKRYSQQDKSLVKKWINEDWPEIQKWVKQNQAIVYFEDESGVALAPVIGKTWAPVGQTPIVRVTGKRGGVLAMSAISPSGRMCFRLESRKINTDVMLEFLGQISAQHPRRKVAVIMDQAPCHVAKRIQALNEQSSKLRVYYLPPYSPELNPDEKVWRHMKHIKLKNHQAQDKKQLGRLVIGALRSMQKTPELTKRFFENYLT
jgi:transposase